MADRQQRAIRSTRRDSRIGLIMVLALIFAEILAGGVLLISGITGHSITEVAKGQDSPILPLANSKSPLSSEASPEGSGSSGEGEPIPGGGGKLSPSPSEAGKAGTSKIPNLGSAGTGKFNWGPGTVGEAVKDMEKEESEGKKPRRYVP